MTRAGQKRDTAINARQKIVCLWILLWTLIIVIIIGSCHGRSTIKNMIGNSRRRVVARQNWVHIGQGKKSNNSGSSNTIILNLSALQWIIHFPPMSYQDYNNSLIKPVPILTTDHVRPHRTVPPYRTSYRAVCTPSTFYRTRASLRTNSSEVNK